MSAYINKRIMTKEQIISHLRYVQQELSEARGSDHSGVKALEEAIKELSSVENMGEWIAQDIHNCCTVFKCSKCGYEHNFLHLYGKPTADYPYCPNCGSDMRGET